MNRSSRITLSNYHFSSPKKVLHYLHVMSDNKKLHTIAIDMHNYQELRNLGHTGESFNTVISRLIKSTKSQEPQKDVLVNDGGA